MVAALRVAVCQLDNRPERREAALSALAQHVADTRAELVVLPELPFSRWLAADPVPDPDVWQRSVAEHEAAVSRLGELGAAAVVASRPTVEADGQRHNQAFAWTPQGGAARVRDKYYLPDEPGYWEASWYDRGELAFDTCAAAGGPAVTGHDLGGLLADAAARAELDAPPVDPLTALARTRRRREQRRGHAVAFAFVAFALLLQLVPAEALGAARAGAPAVALPAAASRG